MLAKFIDRISYRSLLALFVGGVLLCWLVFHVLTPLNHGIEATVSKNVSIGAFETFYFSVVTVSSLGYGDFRPVGFGRVVAILEVIFGLMMLALIVSKVASERTSTLVRLFYTSDIERRVREFVEDNGNKNSELRARLESHDFDKAQEIIESFKIAFSAYLHFFAYQSRTGEIEGRWAEKIFLRLLRSTTTSTELIAYVARLNNSTSQERKRCNKAMARALTFGRALSEKYDEANICGTVNHIEKTIKDSERYLAKLKAGRAHPVTLTTLTDELLEKIKADLPPAESWERDIHKRIAKKHRLSNNLARRAISLIMEEEA